MARAGQQRRRVEPGQQPDAGQVLVADRVAVGVGDLEALGQLGRRRGQQLLRRRAADEPRRGRVGVDHPAVRGLHGHRLAEHLEDAREALARAAQVGDQLGREQRAGGTIADGAEELELLARRLPALPAQAEAEQAEPAAVGVQRHRHPPAHAGGLHLLGVLRAEGDAGDVLARELGDVHAAVVERLARRGLRRVRARLERGQPGRLARAVGAVDPAREALRLPGGVHRVQRAGVGEVGDEQVHEPVDPLPRPRALDGPRDLLEQLGLARRRARRPVHAGRGEGHRQRRPAARRRVHVHRGRQRGDRRQPEAEPRRVRARLHPAPVVGDGDAPARPRRPGSRSGSSPGHARRTRARRSWSPPP